MKITAEQYFYQAIRDTGNPIKIETVRNRLKGLKTVELEQLFRRCLASKDFYRAFMRKGSSMIFRPRPSVLTKKK
jgi:hypothetical protein